ncbi:MAG: hypothetical protein GF344_17155 [Chitinivibrionales bacterium]|nr:hypothetical protein [Chitinivibrionales bacterium]
MANILSSPTTECLKKIRERGQSINYRRERPSKISRVKKEFCFIACRLLQFRVVQVAQFPGCSPSAVSW